MALASRKQLRAIMKRAPHPDTRVIPLGTTIVRNPTARKPPAMTDNTVHEQTIQLTGARRTFTGRLKNYPVVDGQITLLGHAKDVLAWARDIEINFAGFPLGDKRIEQTERAIAAAHGGKDESHVLSNRPDAHGQAQVHGDAGAGVPQAAEAAAVGNGGDAASAGAADAGAPGGDGHAPQLTAKVLPAPGTPNPKLVSALVKLDDTEDAHWTAQGLPKIEAVTKMSGLQGLTRAMIEGANPRRRIIA